MRRKKFLLLQSLPLFVLDHAIFFVHVSPAQDKSSRMQQFSSLIFKHIFTGKRYSLSSSWLRTRTLPGWQGPGVSAIVQGHNTRLVSYQALGWMPDLFSEANFWLESCILMPCIKLNTTQRASRKQCSPLVMYWFHLPCARYVSLPWHFPTP